MDYDKIEKLNDEQFAILFSKIITEIQKDPVKNFIEAKGFMDFNPTPAQRVALKIIFKNKLDDSVKHKVWEETTNENGHFDLNEIFMTETEIYKMMTGREYEDIEQSEDIIINMINLIVGRRGGKTTLSAMLAIFSAIKNNWKPYLKKTPFATVLTLSHSREFSEEVIELIRTFIQTSPILSRLINKKKKNTASTINLVVPWYNDETGKTDMSRVQIKVGAASSKTTRGVAACTVLLDEIAFWGLDDNLKETDEKILKAVRPATKQFGDAALVIKLSSPGIKQGVLYNEFERWKAKTLPENYVVFKAPSWVWNTILPKKEFIREWELDQDGFDTEYRANFVDSLSNFIIPEFVDMAVIRGAKFNPPEDKSAQVTYKAAIDAAFKGDRFTFSVVGLHENRIKQYVSKGWEGSKKNPVKASEVAAYIRTIVKEFGIDVVAADQFAFQPLREIFDQFGVTLEENTFNNTLKKKIYYNLKKLIHSQQIDLLDNELQSKEIKELIVEQTTTGSIKIGHPAGGHDDFADSLAVAAYKAVESSGVAKTLFETSLPRKQEGILTDATGRAFNAPSPEMLADSYGHEIIDNSESYVKDPESGKLVHIDELDDDDDGVHLLF